VWGLILGFGLFNNKKFTKMMRRMTAKVSGKAGAPTRVFFLCI